MGHPLRNAEDCSLSFRSSSRGGPATVAYPCGVQERVAGVGALGSGGSHTHILWIPKGKKRFPDSYLIHDLPQRSVSMIQGVPKMESGDPGADREKESPEHAGDAFQKPCSILAASFGSCFDA